MTKSKNISKVDGRKTKSGNVAPLAQNMQRLLDIRKDSELWKQIIAENLRGKAAKHEASFKEKTSGQLASSGENPVGHVSAPENTPESESKLEHPYMKSRLDQLIAQRNIHMNYGELKDLLETCFGEPFPASGFDPYGSEDESGLHEGNTDLPENILGQDDYEIEEVQDASGFSYDYVPTHHIEVEVNSGLPGSDGLDNEASCEFTFEYHRNGNLIQSKQFPASDQLENKLRQLSLMDDNGGSCSHGKNAKKAQKETKKTNDREALPGSVDDSHCLFCQYEAFFGKKPIRTMEWLERKASREEERRRLVREKLQAAKSRTSRRNEPLEQGSVDAAQSESGSVE